MAGERASGGPGSGSGGVSGGRAARLDLLAAAFVAVAALLLVVLVVQARERQTVQAAVDRAAAAFAAADQAEARTWANDAWASAQRAVDTAMADLHTQDTSPLFVRSYARTTALLQRAIIAADAARTAAELARRSQQPANLSFVHVIGGSGPGEAQAAIDRVETAIDFAKNLIAALEQCRRKPRDFRQDLESIKADVDSCGFSLTGIEGMFSRMDYAGAKARADSLKGQLDMLIADMQTAKAKIKC